MSEDDKRREKRCLLSVHPDVSGLVQLAVTKEVFAKCASRCQWPGSAGSDKREKRCLLSVYPDVSGLVQLAVTKEKRGVC